MMNALPLKNVTGPSRANCVSIRYVSGPWWMGMCVLRHTKDYSMPYPQKMLQDIQTL